MANAARPLPPLLLDRLSKPWLLQRPVLDAILNAAPLMQLDQARDRRAFGYAVCEGVAVVPVMGTLMKRGTGSDWLDEWLGVVSCEALTETINRALRDPEADSILLQIDSPGGEANGIFDLAEFVFKARGDKPLVAMADEWAYSAGYLLAAACDRVVLPQTGGVGSIGVYSVRLDVTAADAQDGVRWDIVEFGARKADGHPHKPVTDAELSDLQASVDRIGGMFVDAVHRYRGLSVKTIVGFEARGFDGEEAVTVGLADQVATFTDTIMELATAPATSRTQRRGSMATETPKAEVINLEEKRAEFQAEGRLAEKRDQQARVQEITDLCLLAKCGPEKMAALLADERPLAAIRKELIDAKAAESTDQVQNLQRVPTAGAAAVAIDVEKIFAKRRAVREQTAARRSA